MSACRLVRWSCLALLASAALAQNDGERHQAELGRNQRSLQQSRAEVERLLDLRLRHDLGLPTDTSDRTFRTTGAVTTETMEKMQAELGDEERNTAGLVERYEQLRVAVEQLRAEAAAKVRSDELGGTELPVAGTAAGKTGVGRRLPGAGLPTGAAIGEQGNASPAPAGEAAPPAVASEAPIISSLDPLRAQIHGSTDHQRVAHALFKAGQALMDRAGVAADQGQVAAAKELDDRAKERLQRALDELAPLLKAKEPPFEALFCRGRCLELLFRLAERRENLSTTGSSRDWQRREQEVRDPFLQITARDVTKAGARGESEVLGAWGKAAQSAIEHFRWMNLNAAYDATPAIRALTWPGEREQ